MNWYLAVLKNYAGFSGRARRTEYWMFILFNFLISIAISVVERILGIGGTLGLLYSLAVLVPGIAVGIRRLHDTNRSGWWLLLALIPIVGWIVLIVFAVQEGTHGANPFGPDPKAQPAGVQQTIPA
jgi:uncharacterized membrane protein YhaH (DUF805 family)